MRVEHGRDCPDVNNAKAVEADAVDRVLHEDRVVVSARAQRRQVVFEGGGHSFKGWWPSSRSDADTRLRGVCLAALARLALTHSAHV